MLFKFIPQMSPMNWIFLMFFNLMNFLFLMLYLYYMLYLNLYFFILNENEIFYIKFKLIW